MKSHGKTGVFWGREWNSPMGSFLRLFTQLSIRGTACPSRRAALFNPIIWADGLSSAQWYPMAFIQMSRMGPLPPVCTPSIATSHWFYLWNNCNHHLISSTFIQSLINSSLGERGSFPRTQGTYKSPSSMQVEQYFSNTNVIMTLWY